MKIRPKHTSQSSNFQASQCKYCTSAEPACLPTLKTCILRHISHHCSGRPVCLLTVHSATLPLQWHCHYLQLSAQRRRTASAAGTRWSETGSLHQMQSCQILNNFSGGETFIGVDHVPNPRPQRFTISWIPVCIFTPFDAQLQSHPSIWR